jgi:peptidoglycan/LPS O-acetylase OafA/YrhL
MTLSQSVAVVLLALQSTIAGWVGWRYFHMRQEQRWRSAGLSFGVALVFLLNAITAASDLPWEVFLTISLVTCGLSLFVCGLWLGIALVTRDQSKPAA